VKKASPNPSSWQEAASSSWRSAQTGPWFMSSFPIHPDGWPEAAVEARSLSVAYRGKRRSATVLREFTASFQPGITGLVGPNGAGKTTFLRAVAGLLPTSPGSLLIHGREPRAFRLESGMGILPESPSLPGHLTASEFLSGLQGSNPTLLSVPAGEPGGGRAPLGLDGLNGLEHRRLDTLSLGQRKRVALTAALTGDPAVLLLDEPTNGLDPVAVRVLRETLREERARGATLIVSSHHLDELQRLADALVFVREGRVAGAWTRADALDRFGTLESLFHHALEGE